MENYNQFNIANTTDNLIRKNSGTGFFRMTFGSESIRQYKDEESYLSNLALSIPVLKIGCNPYAYYEEVTNTISHIWIYGESSSLGKVKNTISNSGATIGENEYLNIMNESSRYSPAFALKNNGIIVRGYSAKIARALLEFAKEGVIFCPDAAIYYLMKDFFPSREEIFEPHLQNHYGSLLCQEESRGDNGAKSTFERKWGCLYITVNKYDKESEIIFHKDNESVKYNSKTIKGMLCLEIINNSNEPVSTNELKDKARGLYSVNSRHGESNRAISDAKWGVNDDLKNKLGVISNAIIKVQNNELKFDDNLYKNAILKIA